MQKETDLFPQAKTAGGKRLPFSTGSLRLDFAINTGGILPGDLVDICGPCGSGKTVFCQQITASAQNRGLPCAWIDIDHSFEAGFAHRCGVDLSSLYVVQPKDAEQALDVLACLAGCSEIGVIILDSLNTLITRRELESDAPGALDVDEFEAECEELTSQALRQVWQIIQQSLVSIVYTRTPKRGIAAGYHRLSKHPARLAPGQRATVRLRLDPKQTIEVNGTAIGQRILIEGIRKIKPRSKGFPGAMTVMGRGVVRIPPFCEPFDLDIMYNEGIVKIGEVFDLGLGLGLIHHRNGKFMVDYRILGPDRASSVEAIKRFDLGEDLEQAIRQKMLW